MKLIELYEIDVVDMIKLWYILVRYEDGTLWVNTLQHVLPSSCKIVCHQSNR